MIITKKSLGVVASIVVETGRGFCCEDAVKLSGNLSIWLVVT